MSILKKLTCVWLAISIFSPVIVYPMQQALENNEQDKKDKTDVKFEANPELDNFTVLFAPGLIQSKKILEGFTRDEARERLNNYDSNRNWSEEEIIGYLGERNVLANAWERVFLKKVKSVDFPNIIARDYNGQVSFGQRNETDVLEAEFQREITAGKRVLVAGNSRGGFVALNGNFEGAAGIFVQSTVGSMEDIADNYCKKFGAGWVPFSGKFVHRLVMPRMFPSYDPNGPKPIDMVGRIPVDMPIFIACTADDNMMPESSSAKLVEKLIETGHTKVYFYRGHGWHTCMYNGVEFEERERYSNTVHAFMKEIGLLEKNYDCRGGEAELNRCKVNGLPEIRALRRALQGQEWRACWKQNAIVFAITAALAAGTFFIGKKIVNKYRASKRPIKKNFIQGLVAKFVKA